VEFRQGYFAREQRPPITARELITNSGISEAAVSRNSAADTLGVASAQVK
jgi:hypothetical protein